MLLWSFLQSAPCPRIWLLSILWDCTEDFKCSPKLYIFPRIKLLRPSNFSLIELLAPAPALPDWRNLHNRGRIHCIPFSVPPPFTFFRCSQSMLVRGTASLPPISQQQCLQIQHKLRHVGTFIMKNNSKSPPFPVRVPHPADTWLQCRKYCSSGIQITSSVPLLRLLADCSSLQVSLGPSQSFPIGHSQLRLCFKYLIPRLEQHCNIAALNISKIEMPSVGS